MLTLPASPAHVGRGTGRLQPPHSDAKSPGGAGGLRTPGCGTWSRDQHPDTHLCFGATLLPQKGGAQPNPLGGAPKVPREAPLKVPFSVNFQPVSSRIFY